MTIEELDKFYNETVQGEQESLKIFLNPSANKEYILISLVTDNVEMAVHAIYYKTDSLTARNYFYKAGAIESYLHDMYETGNYTASIFINHRSICYAIISDNNRLINHYLQYKDNFLKYFNPAFIKAVQACIKNDNEELQTQIELLEKYTKKKNWEKHYAGCVNSFKGILNQDKKLLEEGINELLLKTKKQQLPVVVDFLNIEALTLAKLAYRKGIIVDINNPLLPKEMIPVKELDRYESYDFLKEFEK